MRAGLPDVVRRRLDPGERYGLRATLFALAVVLAAVPFGLLLHQVVTGAGLTELDTVAANRMHAAVQGRETLLGALKALTFLGSPPWFYPTVGLAALWCRVRGRARVAAYLVVTTLLGGAVNSAVKLLVARPRPVLDDPVATAQGYSFPSGHAMASTICYGALLLAFLPALPRRARGYAAGFVALLVAAIGFTRLALGVHYLTDVLGGVALGLAWLAAGTAAFSVWREEEGGAPVRLDEGIEDAAPAEPRA